MPLLVAVAIGLTLPAARRLGAILATVLLAYSLGFCVWASASPDLQRPDWDAVAADLGEPAAPRATVTWTLGEASLRYYLSTGAIQVTPDDGYDWLVHEVDFVSDGEVAPPLRQTLGPGFRETGTEDTGRLFIRRFELPGPGLAPLRLRRLKLGAARLPQQRRPPRRSRPGIGTREVRVYPPQGLGEPARRGYGQDDRRRAPTTSTRPPARTPTCSG